MRIQGFAEAAGAVRKRDYRVGNLVARGRSRFFLAMLLVTVCHAALASSLGVSSRLCIKGNPDNDNGPNISLIGCTTTQSDPNYPGLTTLTSSYDSQTDPNNTYTYGSYDGNTSGYATYGKLGAVANIVTVNGTPATYDIFGYGSIVHVAPDSASVVVSFDDQFTLFTTPGLHYYQPIMTLDGAAISGVDSPSLSVGQASGLLEYCAGIGASDSDAFGSCGSTYKVSSGAGGESVTTTLLAPIPFYSGDTISLFAELEVAAEATTIDAPGAAMYGPNSGVGEYDSFPFWVDNFYTANESAAFGDTAELTGFIVTDSAGLASPFTFTAASGADYFAPSDAPEPATWLLILGGGALFAGRRLIRLV